MKAGNTIRFVIENRIEELPAVAGMIEGVAEKWKLSAELTMNLNLVIEEALSNIIFYAFNDNKNHQIKISVSHDLKRIKIEITDNGLPFNPLKHHKPNITLPAEERPVGGLGILLMSQIMDEMNYERKGNQNVLTLYKSV